MTHTEVRFVRRNVAPDGERGVHEGLGEARVSEDAHCHVRVRVKSPIEERVCHARVDPSKGVHVRVGFPPRGDRAHVARKGTLVPPRRYDVARGDVALTGAQMAKALDHLGRRRQARHDAFLTVRDAVVSFFCLSDEEERVGRVGREDALTVEKFALAPSRHEHEREGEFGDPSRALRGARDDRPRVREQCTSVDDGPRAVLFDHLHRLRPFALARLLSREAQRAGIVRKARGEGTHRGAHGVRVA